MNFKIPIMKKITLFIAVAIFTYAVKAQTTLTYNTDNVITAVNSVACGSSDNYQARYFVMADFGLGDMDFEITEGEIGVQSVDAGGLDVTISVYAADASFPTGYPGAGTLLGSEVVNIPGGSDESIVSYTFTTPVVVPAGTEYVLLESYQPDTGLSFFIGGTADETADSWLASLGCALPEYSTATDIGFPDAHYYLTVTGDEILGVDDVLANAASIFPNPTNDVLNIDLPSNVEILSANLYDILGKDTNLKLVDGTINTSNLARGVYILNVRTDVGSLTHKIVKQ
jgi:hypothetical protein